MSEQSKAFMVYWTGAEGEDVVDQLHSAMWNTLERNGGDNMFIMSGPTEEWIHENDLAKE
jgi:hypothetical protein